MKLHNKIDNNYLYKYLFIVLLPLVIFGIVKNGLLLYKETTSMYIILKPTIFLAISLLLGLFSELLFNKKFRIGKNVIYLLLLYMISSINTPIWLFIFSNILLLAFLKFDKGIINKVALTELIVIGIMFLLHNLSYTNTMESSGQYVFTFMDLIIKGQVGAISTCNLILVIILLISLLTNTLYKRNIALISILSFVIYFVIISIIHEPNIYLKLLINSTAIFELIMISTINEYSPRTNKGEIIYAILVGVVSAILCNYISIYIGALITITLLSPLKILFDKNKLFR